MPKYTLRAWIKENGTPIQYIRRAETIDELLEMLSVDVDKTDILSLTIYKEV